MNYQIVVAGGGPVGLAAAIELGQRGIECVVVEPRVEISQARPRCKTLNVRTLEHLRRWGIVDRVRAAAPLSPKWSKDLVFCTSLAGYELSRFTGVFGLTAQGDRFPELGQQSPQFAFEGALREVVNELPTCTLMLGARVTDVAQTDDVVRVTIADESGERVITADYALGCDGPRSIVREAIGVQYVGSEASRPSFGMTFRAPRLWDCIAHGRAWQYWVVNPFAPAVLGPQDGKEMWWASFVGIDRERGEREAETLLSHVIGAATPVEVRSFDPWRAKMQLANALRVGRVFLAGDAAHLNPPYGGHGLNTGIGDAVDIGWKLAAVLDGWGGDELLDSYEAERRPVQAQVIAEAEANMATLTPELGDPDIAEASPAGDAARRRADARIQETKAREFLAVDFVLGLGYNGSPIVVVGESLGAAPETPRPGFRLAHTWLPSGESIFDTLGVGLTLLCLAGEHAAALVAWERACAERGVPLTVRDLRGASLAGRYGVDLVLVRPDQHVAWCGDTLSQSVESVIDTVRGAAHSREPV